MENGMNIGKPKKQENKIIQQTTIIRTSDSPGGGSVTWGLIGGLLSDQTDLQTALNAKQATLISGTNIKTVNGISLLGAGDITIGGSTTWGSITGTLSTQTDLQTALDGKVDENAAITGATKTKITYDAKGLVTAGADATTADIADSSNKRYVTDAQLVVIGNTSGTNTGDQTTIVGITGTKAQFNTAVSDGNILFVGDIVGVTDGDKDDIVVSASGATWTVDTGVITLAKMANVATSTIFYRKTAGTGVPEVQTLATLKTDLGLTGTNSGDQTSIVGITGTKAQFDTAVTDGNFLYVGDITQYTNKLAQDAIGAMLDSSLTYVDGTPLLQRSALTGAITASAGSNTTSLGSFTTAQLNTALSDNDVATLAGSETFTNKTLTSPILTTPVLGTPASGNLDNCTADGTDKVGFRNIPSNSKSTAYTAVLSDAGKSIDHPSTDANARTFTIPDNSSVAYPIGTALSFSNMTSQVVTIAITTDTMYLAGTGTTGSRTLAQYGVATARKLTSTTWIISGIGLT